MQGFNGLTIIILASNERRSLRDTVLSVIDVCSPEDLSEIIVFLKSADCPASEEFHAIQSEEAATVNIQSYVQKEATIQRALSEIPALVKSSHFLIMSADFANDPQSIPEMISRAKQSPEAIICASKWHKESVVRHYGFIRTAGNRLFNRAVAAVLRTDGRDLFSFFQIYPVDLIELLDLHNPETFVYEYTIKPIVWGIDYVEIPTVYRDRTENRSNFYLNDMIKTSLRFFMTAIRMRHAFIKTD